MEFQRIQQAADAGHGLFPTRCAPVVQSVAQPAARAIHGEGVKLPADWTGQRGGELDNGRSSTEQNNGMAVAGLKHM
jgi:hypothetical protein